LRSATFSIRRSELDPLWSIIRSLAAAGRLVILGRSTRMDARHREEEHTMNVFAFSTSRAAEWGWRIVGLQGETLEESSGRFPTMAEALAAGTEQLQIRRDRDRQPPAQAPWHRRF
jgi:hypothetical protein